jgi:predicted MFS family arabinose efflux permease
MVYIVDVYNVYIARRWRPLVVVALAQLLVLLDATVANVALPAVRRGLALGPVAQAWVLGGYTLAFGGLLLAGGRAADAFGRRRVFRAGTALFGLASLACGCAGDGASLVAARCVQGAGAALLAPSALALLTVTYGEPDERRRALTVWAALGGLGATVGVVAGGLLVQLAGWRSVFLINAPTVAVVLAAARRVLPRDEPRARAGRPSAGRGPAVARRWDRTRARWPASLVRGAAGQALLGATQLAAMYLISLQAQRGLGLRPLVAGLGFLPMGLVATGSALVGGRLVDRHGVRRTWVGAATAGALGLVGFGALVGRHSYVVGMLGPAVAVGAALPVMSLCGTTTAVTGSGAGQAGAHSGVVNAAVQVGGAVGVAAAALGLTGGLSAAYLTVAAFPLGLVGVALGRSPLRARPASSPPPGT